MLINTKELLRKVEKEYSKRMDSINEAVSDNKTAIEMLNENEKEAISIFDIIERIEILATEYEG